MASTWNEVKRNKLQGAFTDERRVVFALRRLVGYIGPPTSETAQDERMSSEELTRQAIDTVAARVVELMEAHPATLVSHRRATTDPDPVAPASGAGQRPPAATLHRNIERLRALDELDIPPHVAAAAMKINPRTVDRWLTDNAVPQGQSFRRLDDLVRLTDHLRQAFPDVGTARTWLRSDNPYLGGFTPFEALSLGKLGRIDAALTAWEAGTYV